MKVTIFNAVKSTGKYPKSPYNDDSFLFETSDVTLSGIFDKLSSHFTLNIPLTKNNIHSKRSVTPLKEHLQALVDYIIIDIDDVQSSSDREIALKYFREEKLRVILGEGRRPYNIKGVMKTQNMSYKQGKEILTKIQEHVPGTMDLSVMHRASYQAPILKHSILLDQSDASFKEYPRPDTIEMPVVSVQVSDDIEQICIEEFSKLGFSFNKQTDDGFVCSHISERKSPNGFTWRRVSPFSMSHWNPGRNASVWREVIKTPEYKAFQKGNSKKEVQNIMPRTTFNTNERYLQNKEEEVADFLSNKQLLTVQSPMGTAKSNIIEEVLYQSNKMKLRVLFLTNRISLADDICNKYENIKHYLGTELEENNYQIGDNLAVQIDSLYKYSTKYFDVIIMDEFSTTMMKLLSIEKNQMTTTKKIFSFKKKKLVILDAFLFEEAVDLFRDSKESEIQITNSYRDQVDLVFYQQKDNFIVQMIETAKREKITFSSGSTKILKIVNLLCQKNKLSCITISSETPKNERDLIYKSMQNKTSRWDILMYSPSLTVGVSNENDTLKHFHFDTGMSMDVLSSIQMVKRTRKAEEIHLFLHERLKYQPTSLERIQLSLSDYNQQDEDGDSVGITSAGGNLSKIIQLNNILENRHKESFKELLKFQFKIEKRYIKKDENKVQPVVYKLSKAVELLEKEASLDIFDEYKKMSQQEISDVELKLFNTTKKELLIKEFNNYKNDTSLQLFKSCEMDSLIKKEIEQPGTIEKLKNAIVKGKEIEKLTRDGVASIIEYNKVLQQGIDLSSQGFYKKKNLWVQEPLIKSLKEIYYDRNK